MFLHSTPWQTLRKRWKLTAAAGFLLAIISLLVSLVFPLEYRADAQVLIISQSRYGVDPYTMIKSAERVGENLAQVVKTDDFYKKVMDQPGYALDQSRFVEISDRTRRQRWGKTVRASMVYGTGVLNISAYHKKPEQAKQLAGAAAAALSAKGWEYVGGDVIIKLVNQPVVSRWPVRPNLLLNAILGFLSGAAASGVLLLSKKKI